MIGDESYKLKIDEIAKNFTEAESRIKKAELEHHQLSIPSINELRYAGHHILNATQQSEDSKILEELDKADRHVKRSSFDAIEALLLYKLEEIKNFDQEYRTIPETLSVVGDYISKITTISSIVENIEEIDKDTREAKYKEIDRHYEVIKQIDDELKMSIPAIVSLIDQNEQKQQKEHRKFLFQISLTVLGIVVAIVIALNS